MRFEWFYLVIGFALYFVIIKGRGRKKDKNTWLFALKLTLALILLLAINYCAEALLWKPTGRGDLQTLSLLLWAVVIDWIMNGPGKERGEIQTVVGSFLLALIAFSLWTIRKIEGAFPLTGLLLGLTLPLGASIFKTLLEGLTKRLRLSQVPLLFTGFPMLFWLAMLLFISCWGFERFLPLS